MNEVPLIIALAMSVALNLVGAVLISKMSARVVQSLDQAHERTTRYTEGLIDRLMATDFGTFKAYQMIEEAPEVAPPAEPEVPSISLGPDRGGFGSRLGLTALTNRHLQPEPSAVRASEELLETEIPG